MADNGLYRIPFIGLKNGIHHYKFEVGETFFSKFEFAEEVKGEYSFEVELEKLTNQMNLFFELDGILDAVCDRCGDRFSLPIDGRFALVVKFGEETSDLSDDLIVLGPSEHFIELDQLFFEYIHLSVPARTVHEDESDCNQEALEALRRFELKEKEEEIDPRWSALKKLK